MKMHLLARVGVLFTLALLIPAARALVHGPYERPARWDIGDQRTVHFTEKSKRTQPLVLDTFQHPTHNDLGFWHGTGENLTIVHQPGWVRLFPTDPDQNFHTQFDTHQCFSLLRWHDQFLHVVFEGTDQFTVSLNEHNPECNPRRAPFPGVADSVQTSRYVMGSNLAEDDESPQRHRGKKSLKHIPPDNDGTHNNTKDQIPVSTVKKELFIPLSHFRINQWRVVSVSFTGFYTPEPVTLYRVEIVPSVPPPSPENNLFTIPEKLPSGQLILRCSRPNSFAFGIDDGQPQFAQEVMRILDEENVRVTFFAVGAGLSDPSTNFTKFYREMLRKGHQVALHSNTHPKMEALPSLAEIDEEITQSKEVFREQLNIESSYFRPPYGTVGARMRQELAKDLPDARIVNWSVDIEDWLWADSPTPEKQLDAFYRGIARGGNLAVMHFLNPTTVKYLRRFIRHAKDAGFQIMRVDQCMGDPAAPPL